MRSTRKVRGTGWEGRGRAGVHDTAVGALQTAGLSEQRLPCPAESLHSNPPACSTDNLGQHSTEPGLGRDSGAGVRGPGGHRNALAQCSLPQARPNHPRWPLSPCPRGKHRAICQGTGISHPLPAPASALSFAGSSPATGHLQHLPALPTQPAACPLSRLPSFRQSALASKKDHLTERQPTTTSLSPDHHIGKGGAAGRQP